MPELVVEKPYRFVPPHRGRFWSAVFRATRFHAWWLRRTAGIQEHACRGVERLRRSLQAGHGVLLTPNHCRTSDPLALGWLACQLGCDLFCMASWHLFNESRLVSWALRRMGAFSVYREGVDRQAINAAIEILERAERPLVIFPEGACSRTNDRLHALLDGVAFIARAAARRRARRQPGAQVVIHPVAIKYVFQGDLQAAADPLLTDMERRLTLRPRPDQPVLTRVARLGHALLCLKEVEYLGAPQSGPLADRVRSLIDRILQPLEQAWLGQPGEGPAIPRVKAVRMRLLPDMVQGRVSAAERRRRWDLLEDLMLVQQLSAYPPDYLAERPTVDRVLETIESFREDLTGQPPNVGPKKVILEVGDPIPAPASRERREGPDPLMRRLEQSLQAMLDRLAGESPVLAS